jgi:uncharacterized protein
MPLIQTKGRSVRYVPCPRCGTRVAWTEANRFRPFCSERCKLIDLGQWAAEDYRIDTGEQAEKRPEDQ